MFLQRADEMQEEQAARLHHFLGAGEELAVIITAHMLDHAHADHPIEGTAAVGQIPIVHPLHGEEIFKPFFFDPLLESGLLFFAQRNAHALDAVLLGRLDQKVAPSAANVQKFHARFQVQLL